MAKITPDDEEDAHSPAPLARPICGIVMPISATDGYPASHWADVRAIINAVADSAGFEAKLVSDEAHVGIIHKRIIQNLYENPVVVCDVSSKNPNVMFELGIRLAFDKPTIVIKDDMTGYSFDTSPIEHLGYPSDLRYGSIIDFKDQLKIKIQATYKEFTDRADYSTFLKRYGTFMVPKIDKKEVSEQDYIIEEIRDLKRTLAKIESRRESEYFQMSDSLISSINALLPTETRFVTLRGRMSIEDANKLNDAMRKAMGVRGIVVKLADDKTGIAFTRLNQTQLKYLEHIVSNKYKDKELIIDIRTHDSTRSAEFPVA